MVTLLLAACGPTDRPATRTWWADWDGDGYGDPWSDVDAAAQPEGYVDNHDDCDDTQATAHPGGVEVCDLFDNDCDGWVDILAEGPPYIDGDGDGYGDLPYCGGVEQGGDCAAGDPSIHPGATETCDDGVDSNCDGIDCTTAERGYDARIHGDGSVSRIATLRREGGDRLVFSTAEYDASTIRAYDGPFDGPLSYDTPDAQVDGHTAYLRAFPDHDGDGLDEALLDDDDEDDGVAELWSGTLTGEAPIATAEGRPDGVAADFDGDGAPDLLTTRMSWAEVTAGVLYVYRGPIEGDLSTGDAWAVVDDSEAEGDGLGWYTVAADTDGDGIVELYATATNRSGDGAILGRWDLGGGGTRTLADADAQLLVEDVYQYSRFFPIFDVGDVSGDGRDDVVFGQEGVDGDAEDTEDLGTAWLLPPDPVGTLDLATVAPASWTGVEQYDEVGQAVAGGDFDGDGAADLALVRSNAPAWEAAGTVDLIRGPVEPGSWSLADATWVWEAPAGVVVAGEPIGTGDYDGDGVDDLAADGRALVDGQWIDAVYVLAEVLR